MGGWSLTLLCMILGSLVGTANARTASSYLDLDLRQNRYFGGVPNPNQDSNYSLFSGDLNLETQSDGFTYKLNPITQGDFNNSDEFYFGVPEAYVQPRKIAPWSDLTIGRKKRKWSHLDEEFNLGIWQPQLRWDYLAPVQQGLTGVFFDWSLSSQLRLTFFTSPLHLPDQGPQYKLNNGRFESSNRWFEQPHGQLLFQGETFAKDAPLYFEINKPSEEEIVMHSSFGLGLQFDHTSEYWTKLNYAYKPRNQIQLGIECSNCARIGNPEPLEVTAVIHPKIVKHHVVTLESGFNRTDDRGWISLTGDFPNASGFPEAYHEAPLDSMVIAGAGYSHYLHRWIGFPSWLGVSYMRAETIKDTKETGLVDDDQVKSSLDRFPFKDLAAIDWSIQLLSRKNFELSFRNRYSYSVPEQGGWLSSGLNLAQGPLSWMLGADILGADVDGNSQDAGLFSTYRANDRVFGGVSYVF